MPVSVYAKLKFFFVELKLGSTPIFGGSMSYRVAQNDGVDLPNVYQRSRDSTGNYGNNVAIATSTPFVRSKSDLNLAANDSVSDSSGYIDPDTFRPAKRKDMIPKPTQRIRSNITSAPPIPPRFITDSNNNGDMATNLAGSDYSPYDFSKSIAESAMDISLLTANANQLRLLITYNQGSQTYTACITFVIMSLVLQMFVAVTMIIVSLMKQNLHETTRQKLKIFTSVGVAIITMINILVASLVVAEQPTNGTRSVLMLESLPSSLVTEGTTATTMAATMATTMGTTMGTTVSSTTAVPVEVM
ncbi:uncharacterized protein LOC131679518 [Topomyia yanbarensis]|uniref:uncharacterized protein LOC131679518 n=1 Tax=Topomyia yanbarensis TaxID=2498891 RepID=UPI00273B313E|nr:uncharacterized protein LOC131679518 [Topomyia yanbarensis]